MSTAMHTCACVCMHHRTCAPSNLTLLHPPKNPLHITCLLFSFGPESNWERFLLGADLTGTRDSITLNENLQPELRPTRVTSQPNMQPRVHPPKGECVIASDWLLQSMIRTPTANGVNTAIRHCMLNTPFYLPCLTQVLSLPASTSPCSSLVQDAQMPWHFGNVRQILAH